LSGFAYVDGEYHAENVPLSRIAALHGTPCYVYSRAVIERNFGAFTDSLAGLPHLVCYAVKANANLAVLNVLSRLGCGFDIVSGGELARVLAAGGDPRRVVFSGVGKGDDEMRAALDARILCFNVESAAELNRLSEIASEAGAVAPVSIRVNPDVDARTHPYISTGLRENKFGVAFEEALPLYREAARIRSIAVTGIDMHIGSQITELDPYREAAHKLLSLVDRLREEGIQLEHIDLGGGLGIRYRDEQPVPLLSYAAMVRELFAGRRERLLFEPGRRLIGDAGVLITRVRFLKSAGSRHFAIVDAAMNDLLRPALYDAWHPVLPVRPRAAPAQPWQIVGPVCESADFLARDRMLALAEGDLIAVGAAGAYAMAMSSNYNARPRACEVLVEGDRAHVVRRRESIADLIAGESIPPA
jgi:diaminopimelate decarboxylase